MEYSRPGPILNWLRRYKPAKVKLTLREGGAIRELDKPEKTKWSQLERVILQLDPVYLEALDAKGALIAARSWDRQANPDDDGEEPDETASGMAALNKADPAVVAAMVLKDLLPQMVQMNMDCADLAVQRNNEAGREARDATFAVLKLISDRLSSLEKSYARLYMDRAEALAAAQAAQAAGNGEGGELDALAMKFIADRMGMPDASSPAPEKKTNGVPHDGK